MSTVLEDLLEIKIEYMKKNKELEQAIESKFMTPSKFSLEVEKIMMEQKFNYIESICYFCELNNVEVESVVKLISKPLKEKLKNDAINLNFMKKTSEAKLPI